MKQLTCLALLLFSGACGDDKPKTAPTTTPTATVDMNAAAVGACGAPATETFVRDFAVTSCSAPHAMEIAGRYAVPDGEYPGGSQLRLDTLVACQPIFDGYVGRSYWDSEYELRTVSPSPSTWAAGDRQVVCLVVGEDNEPLETPARGSKR